VVDTDFRWIFKALGDILWPYKVVKTTLEKCRNIRGRLSSIMSMRKLLVNKSLISLNHIGFSPLDFCYDE
jgi:hypothetical protein